MDTTFEEYAVLSAQIEALEEKKSLLRDKILEEMTTKGEKKVETGVGSFSITKLKKWVYSDKITITQDQLKSDMAKEQSTGEATFTETDSLRFNSLKI